MEKEKTQISLTLAENESVIRTWCENCDDIQIRPMKLGKTGGTGALLIYVEVAVSCGMLEDSVIGKPVELALIHIIRCRRALQGGGISASVPN